MACLNPGNKHIQKADMGNFTGCKSSPRGPRYHCLYLIFPSLCHLSSHISRHSNVFQNSSEDVICNLNSAQHEVATMVKKEPFEVRWFRKNSSKLVYCIFARIIHFYSSGAYCGVSSQTPTDAFKTGSHFACRMVEELCIHAGACTTAGRIPELIH